MPAGPGESLLTTLFGDVHYYFSDPASNPAHDRFDRGSYVYLFYNATQRQTKIEIANHAGTPDQDAFHGYLNLAHVRYSHLQPTLMTLLINTHAIPDHTSWHLPSFDVRNEQKYLHKIHALDIYLWTEKDAATLLNHFKNVIGVDRMEIRDAPASKAGHSTHEHRDSMSPVVQQLEKTAISGHYAQRSASTVSAGSFPGPPTPAAPIASPQPVMGGYNPAAPAAPEPVTYREKTPPPPDDGTGTGLNSVSRYENIPQYPSATGFAPQNSTQTTPQQAYFGGPASPPPPTVRQGSSNTVIPGPPSHTPSFGPMAPSTISHPQLHSPPPPQTSTQYAGYPSHMHQQYANVPGTPGYNPQLPPTPSAPPAYSGPLQSPGMPPPPPQTQTSPPPVGGYSNYSYGAAQEQPQSSQHAGYTGDMHSQVYRPTEGEASHKGKIKRQATNTSSGSGSKDGKPKMEENFQRLEGKVNNFLGRLDKLW